MSTTVLAVIPARAGSKGLPNKCVAPLLGRPLIEFSILHARAASCLSAVCVTTDSPAAAAVARQHGVFVVQRPPELATDAAPIDAALRHAVETYEAAHPGFRADVIVLLYANIPVRAAGVIDRAVEQLVASRADSVRTVAPVEKTHPDWLHRLDGDRMTPFRPNLVHRRQDLEPLFYHDGAVVAVTRRALYAPPSGPDDHHAFFGADRRALVQPPEAAVDVDTPLDLRVAEAILLAGSTPPPAASVSAIRNADESSAAGPRSASIRIGPHAIEPGRVFVIAEAGVNHDGDVANARRLIEAAREAGADAVKFQIFSADRLVARGAGACEYQKQRAGAASQHEMLRKLELSEEAFADLQSHARDMGILFLATPFGTHELQWLREHGVPAIKIASTDLTNTPLLRAAAGTGLPILLSTGAADLDDVEYAVTCISHRCEQGMHAPTAQPGRREHPAYATPQPVVHNLVLLHCVSRYPTPLGDANLRAMSTLRERFGMPVGFSDHTPDVETGAWAAAAGAVVLEKHLTLNRRSAGPDHFFSLVPDELRAYVAAARRAAAAAGDGRVACDDRQRETRMLARGSITALSDIAAGTTLTETVLCVRRPGGGIDPRDWDRMCGRKAVRPIRRGDALRWSDIE